MSYPYGLFGSTGSSADEKLWECLKCEGTYTATLSQLRTKGWQTHTLASKEIVLLCPECRPPR